MGGELAVPRARFNRNQCTTECKDLFYGLWHNESNSANYLRALKYFEFNIPKQSCGDLNVPVSEKVKRVSAQ